MTGTKDLAIDDKLIAKVQRGSAEMTEPKALALAAELYGRGQYKQAANVCRQILQHKGTIADAHNILGVSLAALGNHKAAVASIQKAISLSPSMSSYHSNLGEILRIAGENEAASASLKEALRLQPSNAQAHNNLGIICYENKEYERAVEEYREALKYAPELAEAWNNLGNSLRLLEDKHGARAAYERALDLRENYPEVYNNLGTLLREEDKTDQAKHALRKAIAQNPRYTDAILNLAGICHVEGEDVEALRHLGEILNYAPKHVKTLLMVARVQTKRGSYALAEQACQIALQEEPDSAEAYMVLGQLMHETDHYDKAVDLLAKATSLDPDNGEVMNFYGVTLKSVGKLDEARECILKAINLNEKMFGAYANLNDIYTFTKDDPLFTRIETFMHNEVYESKRILPLHYAYAKALEDTGDYQRALDHYITGGQIKRGMLNYVEAETFGFFDRIRDTFPKDIFKKRPFAGIETEAPIFIVGMPRSGSTLVEQIISAHPEVHGAGEVKHISTALHTLRDRFPSLSRYPELISELTDRQYTSFAEDYMKRISTHAGDAGRITDKLLTNYFYVGLIHLVFPKARIINTRRNPIDNCLSAFTKLFKDDMPHSYDLGELGRYYRKYEELMDHWNKVLPKGAMKTIVYEDVVKDTEGLARDLLAFLGLPWDDNCLKFHESSRPVKTASVAQVRKPIYTGSVERWRRYGPGLAPLIAALGLEG
ncbi:tetratricopeptide repeat protein [Kamptonema cortianum]|nr:tetratricopeptide repeat protein [Kamptonema cortianum]